MKLVTGIPIALFISDARQGKKSTIEKVVREIEELGFWGISMPDHILHPGLSLTGHTVNENPGWRYADPQTMLGYLAAITERVKIMPRVLVLPYRQPFSTAHGLATIDSLSGGRLVFCPGVGSDVEEFKVMGLPRNKRGKMTDEYLEIMYRLWANERASFSGEFYSFEDVSLVVRPVQQPRPTVWVGGSSKASLARAVRAGEGWTPTCFAYPTAQNQAGEKASGSQSSSVSTRRLAELKSWADEERAKAGQPPLEYAVSSAPPLNFLPKSARSRRRPVSEIEFFSCEGTVDEIRDEFLAYKEAGATSYVTNFMPTTPEAYLEGARLFMKEIAPALE